MNSKKTRKPLSDALANQFVYGAGESSTEPVEEQPEQEQLIEPLEPPPIESVLPVTRKKENKELSLMDKLQVQPKEATKRFTVDLSESMHRKLSILAAKTGRSKADIVRLLLEDALMEVEE
jgi:hypothetical protein